MKNIENLNEKKYNKIKAYLNENNTIVAYHIGRGGKFNNAGYLTYIGEGGINKFTEELFLTEKEPKVYEDGNGNETGLTEEEAATGIGKIDIDGIYDTTYTKWLSDCTDEEINKILNADNGFLGLIKEDLTEIYEELEKE